MAASARASASRALCLDLLAGGRSTAPGRSRSRCWMAARSAVPNSLRPSAVISARMRAFSSRPMRWISSARQRQRGVHADEPLVAGRPVRDVHQPHPGVVAGAGQDLVAQHAPVALEGGPDPLLDRPRHPLARARRRSASRPVGVGRPGRLHQHPVARSAGQQLVELAQHPLDTASRVATRPSPRRRGAGWRCGRRGSRRSSASGRPAPGPPRAWPRSAGGPGSGTAPAAPRSGIDRPLGDARSGAPPCSFSISPSRAPWVTRSTAASAGGIQRRAPAPPARPGASISRWLASGPGSGS